MAGDASSVAVMADAQFSLAKVLRPLTAFEALYQGQPAVVVPGLSPSAPIPFFDSDKTALPLTEYTGRDPDANKPGFDPNLLDYVEVPMGALIKLWVPFPFDPADPLVQQSYRMTLHWRVSDINAYSKRLAGQYHIGTEQAGQPDTTAPVGSQDRFIVPSAQSSIILNQPETAGAVLAQNNNVRREYLVMRTSDGSFQPILPAVGGVGPPTLGVYQQGVTDPTFDPIALFSAFVAFELVCSGDRLHITMDRAGVNGIDTGAVSNWAFDPGELDNGFSIMYGTDPNGNTHPPFPNVGVYIFHGSAP